MLVLVVLDVLVDGFVFGVVILADNAWHRQVFLLSSSHPISKLASPQSLEILFETTDGLKSVKDVAMLIKEYLAEEFLYMSKQPGLLNCERTS